MLMSGVRHPIFSLSFVPPNVNAGNSQGPPSPEIDNPTRKLGLRGGKGEMQWVTSGLPL